MFYLYKLVASDEPDRARYVGQGVSVSGRLACHIRQTKRGDKSHKCAWIRKVLAHGETVLAVQMAAVETKLEANDLERKYIREFRAKGERLTNIAEGGFSNSGARHTEEWKRQAAERMRQRPSAEMTPEIRRKISATLTGRPGRPWSEESKRKVSEAQKGRPVPAERRAKLSEAQTGKKHTKETRAKIAAAVSARSAEVRAREVEGLKRHYASGGVSGMKGKTHSPEARAKMAASATRAWNGGRRRAAQAVAKPWSDERRAAQSAAQLRRWTRERASNAERECL